jgi:glyoxylate reductase
MELEEYAPVIQPENLPRVVADGPLPPAVAELLESQAALLSWEVALTGSAEPVDGIYTYGHPTVDAAVLDRLPGLKVISNHGVGVDHIDVAAAATRGIPVGNTPGVLDGAVADMAFALLLAAARRIVEADRFARSADFAKYDAGRLWGREVHGQTLGIVGMGRIGLEIARRAGGFNMRVLYHNRRRREDLDPQTAVTFVGLGQLLDESDFVVLTCPLTDQTRGLIGAAELAVMKPTAILINIARGPIVDTAAITHALVNRQICAAALDVTDPEPLPRTHPLLACDNLTITPHLGSATIQTRRKMAELSVENLLLGLAGKPLLHQVHA